MTGVFISPIALRTANRVLAILSATGLKQGCLLGLRQYFYSNLGNLLKVQTEWKTAFRHHKIHSNLRILGTVFGTIFFAWDSKIFTQLTIFKDKGQSDRIGNIRNNFIFF